MDKHFYESIFEDFNIPGFTTKNSNFITQSITLARLSRDEDLDLIVELTSAGWSKDRPERYPAGTVRAVEDVIEFVHPAGWMGKANGVIERRTRSFSKPDGTSETIETYSAHSVELDFRRETRPSHVIEWICNVPDRFIWTDPVSLEVIETTKRTIGSGASAIAMQRSARSGGAPNALYLQIESVNLYLMHADNKADYGRKNGQIVYGTCPDQNFRDKIRACLSFVLGKPIIYLGHTEYCEDWQPTFMKSVDALSLDGAAFKVPDLPPYPVNGKYANMIDGSAVNQIVNALLEKYEAIKFNEISWSYWHAVCAPLHTGAISFGSLIEQLQNNSHAIVPGGNGRLLDDQTWKALQHAILEWISTAVIPEEIKPVLKSKTSSLNQAPQNLILKRMLQALGLKTSEVELSAWRHRNIAAHGGFSDNPIELILNSKLLRIFFHRMLAGITKCSDRYIDYYSLGHPVRSLAESVPGR